MRCCPPKASWCRMALPSPRLPRRAHRRKGVGAAPPAPRYVRQEARRPARQAGGRSAPHRLSRHRNTDRFPQRYRLPVYVLENGTAYADELDEKSLVADQPRIEFLRAYTDAMFAAIDAGADIAAISSGRSSTISSGARDIVSDLASSMWTTLRSGKSRKHPGTRSLSKTTLSSPPREYVAFLGLTGPSGRAGVRRHAWRPGADAHIGWSYGRSMPSASRFNLN